VAQTNDTITTTTQLRPLNHRGAGLLNDWLREQFPSSRLGHRGQLRLRYADSEGAVPAASSMTVFRQRQTLTIQSIPTPIHCTWQTEFIR